MTYLRWYCSACSHAEETPHDALYQQLRGAGLLRRIEAKEAKDVDYLLELATSTKSKLICPSCGAFGFLPKLADEAGDGWGEGRKCAQCNAAISPERLEVFPSTTLCPACQQKADRGDSGQADYCPRCGTPMQVRQRRGRGIAAYELACPSCGRKS